VFRIPSAERERRGSPSDAARDPADGRRRRSWRPAGPIRAAAHHHDDREHTTAYGYPIDNCIIGSSEARSNVRDQAGSLVTEPTSDSGLAERQRQAAALLDARRELIDLSRRNHLLHTSLAGKRPHCLEIVNADPDDIFSALSRTGRQFAFSPAPSEELFPLETEATRATTLQRLQTTLAQEPLDRRLLKFFREARTFEEEQGVNILFLAIGFCVGMKTFVLTNRAPHRCSSYLYRSSAGRVATCS